METEMAKNKRVDRQRDRQTDRPALLHDVVDKSVQHDYDKNCDENVIYCAYMTDLQQLPATITKTPRTTTTNYDNNHILKNFS